METAETIFNIETNEKVAKIFSQFMTRVAKFEDLAAAGNKFLVNFRQALEFIRRPSIEKPSEVLEKVIKANNTDRLQSYIKAGYAHSSTRIENLNKLNMSHIQLMEIARKEKNIIDELESIVDNVKLALEAANETLQDYNPDLDSGAACSEEEIVSFALSKPEGVDYATMVAVVYTMVKQDYVMQEKIVSSLNLKTTSGELESYCLMWSLRPYVNNEIMHQAWRLVS